MFAKNTDRRSLTALRKRAFLLAALVVGGCAGGPGGARAEAASRPSASPSSDGASPASAPSESPPSDSLPGATSASYVDVDQYMIARGDQAYQAWRALQARLRADFDDVCGDTFCEGDYGNLEPIQLRCSVNAATGALKACAYVFAGSYETITPSTGSIKVNARTFSCHLPVSGIALDGIIQALGAPGTTPALQRPLPGSSQSIYDALAGCL